MPVFPPRDQPRKKQEQIAKQKLKLIQAIRKDLPLEKLEKIAGKYRKAHISLLKAQIHCAIEETYKNRLDLYQPGELETNIEYWESKTPEQIISEFKLELKIS